MKMKNLSRYIEVRDSVVTFSLPGQPVLTFSAQLPARRHVGERSYTEKGWLWCAFQEALQEAGIDFRDSQDVFDGIWNAFEGAQESC